MQHQILELDLTGLELISEGSKLFVSYTTLEPGDTIYLLRRADDAYVLGVYATREGVEREIRRHVGEGARLVRSELISKSPTPLDFRVTETTLRD